MGKLPEALDLPMEEVSSDIRGMLRGYQQHRRDMLSDTEVRNKKNQVAGLMSQLRVFESELEELQKPYIDKMRDLEKGVVHLGVETLTQSFIHAGVVVRFRKGGEAISWKGNTLKALLNELREEGELTMAERILEARSVTLRLPKIKIEE